MGGILCASRKPPLFSATLAGTHFAQVFPTIDAGIVTVAKEELECVPAHRLYCSQRRPRWFEYRQARNAWLRGRTIAMRVGAGSARTGITQVLDAVSADVAVIPLDSHTLCKRNIDRRWAGPSSSFTALMGLHFGVCSHGFGWLP
jgi:hypothetical protein